MTDVSAILDRIRDEPDDDLHWLAFADWLRDNGRDDEAIVVRLFYPGIRDSIGDRLTLDDALARLARHAKRLGQLAREAENRGSRHPD